MQKMESYGLLSCQDDHFSKSRSHYPDLIVKTPGFESHATMNVSLCTFSHFTRGVHSSCDSYESWTLARVGLEPEE